MNENAYRTGVRHNRAVQAAFGAGLNSIYMSVTEDQFYVILKNTERRMSSSDHVFTVGATVRFPTARDPRVPLPFTVTSVYFAL